MNIIDGLQKDSIRWVERLVTFVGWGYILVVIVQIVLSIILWYFNLSRFYHELFFLGNIVDTIHIILKTFIIAIAAFGFMYLWGRYNFRRFSPLNRRTFPKETTVEDVSSFFGLSVDQVRQLQQQDVIELEETIV